ncbi:endonuclease/exonuclease/phosphatase family protein [Tropicimonas sp. TH_r6]|uniref:endonuclease/exonuclease/phosphatase family protein n=1 Tax=Tropicimonas sp. TH_r6 TaxID=3082085 RepID=UPI0029558D3F|nr:endonuclease/exonuclease/phosphatase family protein [Tropicimonas sp. TH_r6]MDV7144610.1 endonuclease/exonuclease/phosphatase family protein [Tropicimonas sp. TH_r6]
MIADVDPDILLLTGFDYDAGQVTLSAFAERLEAAGAPYPHLFSLRPNSGEATGVDLDGNGRTGEPRDAQGYGRFAGDGGMALLSRFEIDRNGVKDFTDLLWKDLPRATLPHQGGTPFPSPEALEIQRLSTTGHWLVPIRWPGRETLTVMAFSATPPIFDGPEDRNGLRNADELRLWTRLLDGDLAVPPPPPPFVILGNANLDAADGNGLRAVMADFLADPRLQDPRPASPGGAAEADPAQTGDPALDTADWRAVAEDGPGNLRVDYVLPSAGHVLAGSGVHWPSGDAALDTARTASRHRLVWVDLVVER